MLKKIRNLKKICKAENEMVINGNIELNLWGPKNLPRNWEKIVISRFARKKENFK